MTGAVRLEDGRLEDLPGVMAVMEGAFDRSFGEAWTASQCAGLMPLPGVWLTIARDAAPQGADGALETIIGFSLSRIVLDEAELLLLAVKPDVQGRGVGKSLLEEFEQKAIMRGANRLHLEVRNGNPAVKLYENAGFTLVGRRKGYYRGADGQLHDALSLSRPAKA